MMMILDESLFIEMSEQDILEEARKKKRKKSKNKLSFKGFGWWPIYLDDDEDHNCGNMEYNNDMFNKMMGSSDLGDVQISDSIGDGGGMGESLIQEANKHKSKHIKNNSVKKLIWYETEAGNKPAKEFYESLDISIQNKFKYLLKALELNQLPISENKNRQLDKKYKIYELKVRYNEAWYRINYAPKDNYILLTGFQKKSNSTPNNEIDKSIECLKNYIKYGKGEEVNL